MAEFRDFLDPRIDTLAEPVLHPENDKAHKFYAKHGATILRGLGAEIYSRPDAQHWYFGGGSSPVFMEVCEPDIVLPAILRHGSAGWFYTYTGEDEPLWTAHARDIPEDIDTGYPESDSLVVLSEALLSTTHGVRRFGDFIARPIALVRDLLAEHDQKADMIQSKAGIAAHYDIRQEVYVGPYGFLKDPYNQYSSGYQLPGQKLDPKQDNLELLQRQKIDLHAQQVQLTTANRALEIGGGWGGLAVAFAEKAPHADITALTISDEQLAFAQKRAQQANVTDRVTFLGQDYRQFAVDAPFDRVVSVEMIEAVAPQALKDYFDALVRVANPESGIITIQAITNQLAHYARDRHNKKNFMSTSIFPYGCLHPRPIIEGHMQKRGWRTHAVTDLTPSYPPTLREWRRNMFDAKPALTQKWLAEGISHTQIEQFYRGFCGIYPASSEAGFRTGHINDYLFTFVPV